MLERCEEGYFLNNYPVFHISPFQGLGGECGSLLHHGALPHVTDYRPFRALAVRFPVYIFIKENLRKNSPERALSLAQGNALCKDWCVKY